MARFLALCFVFVCLVHATAAQTSPIQVRWADRGGMGDFQELNTLVYEAIHDEMALRGFAREGGGMTMHFSAQEVPMGTDVVVQLAIVESYGLSDAVLDAGAKNEIWYADKPVPENPEDGQFVREYMTREVLSGLVHIENVVQLAFPRSELSMAVSGYFDDLLERRRCAREPEMCD